MKRGNHENDRCILGLDSLFLHQPRFCKVRHPAATILRKTLPVQWNNSLCWSKRGEILHHQPRQEKLSVAKNALPETRQNTSRHHPQFFQIRSKHQHRDARRKSNPRSRKNANNCRNSGDRNQPHFRKSKFEFQKRGAIKARNRHNGHPLYSCFYRGLQHNLFFAQSTCEFSLRRSFSESCF